MAQLQTKYPIWLPLAACLRLWSSSTNSPSHESLKRYWRRFPWPDVASLPLRSVLHHIHHVHSLSPEKYQEIARGLVLEARRRARGTIHMEVLWRSKTLRRRRRNDRIWSSCQRGESSRCLFFKNQHGALFYEQGKADGVTRDCGNLDICK